MRPSFSMRQGPTFRHRIFDGYKATRPPMPDELGVQIPYIRRLVQGLSLKVLEMEGYEADDIIGTLARIGREEGFDVFIVTGDKDFKQLLAPGVTLWDPMKDRVTSYEGFVKECGFEPTQVIDVMGLSGDSIDNIPGVPGIGEKTASELIRQFGTLEGVFEHLEQIGKKRVRENLEKSREEAFISKKLVTIDCFVPMDGDLAGFRIGEPKRNELADLFRELEFKGLWEQFASHEKESAGEYSICRTEEDLRMWVSAIRQKGAVSMSTLSDGDDPFHARLVGISFAVEKGKGVYLPLGHTCADVSPVLGMEKAIETSEARPGG